MSIVNDNSVLFETVNAVGETAVEYNIGRYDNVAYQVTVIGTAPTPKGFTHDNVSPASDTINVDNNGFLTGLKVTLTGTGLPGGLPAGVYYVIVLDDDDIKLASSVANALAGIPVNITSAGTTTDAVLDPGTFSATLKLQQSNDRVGWADVPTYTSNVTSNGDVIFTITNPLALWHRIITIPNAGAITFSVKVCARIDSALE